MNTILNIPLTRQITFGFLITLILPSVLGSCFVFYRITRNKQMFKQLNNQFIFCLFIVYFIQTTLDLPLTIIFLYRGVVAVQTQTFCAYWYILISVLDMCTMYLNAYLSIERYFLVFHNKFLFKYKIILHYIPLVLIPISSFIFVYGVVMLYPCENHFVYYAIACGASCSILTPDFGVFAWTVSFVVPLTIIIFFNIFLLARILLHKRRMLQKDVWQKNKGMILQLLSITGMLYISWLPITLTTVISLAHPTPVLSEIQGYWLLIGLIYIPVLCSPITTSYAMPELRNDIRGWLKQRRPRVGTTRADPVNPTGTH
ncbi:unnamed protein product [Adineta ricciae]|uniref:G-protein coupled receptors family 1 profile domain-containing protein n=2 Tax=Adineta ricciae TaxID=249248 RepID=A0A815AUH0_ADIRI|nr:unnamed protein product [Adineta ricciae]